MLAALLLRVPAMPSSLLKPQNIIRGESSRETSAKGSTLSGRSRKISATPFDTSMPTTVLISSHQAHGWKFAEPTA